MTDDQEVMSNLEFVTFKEFYAVLVCIVSALGAVSNAINIKTFVSMGLVDGVTVSFLVLAVSDLLYLISSFLSAVSIGLDTRELKYNYQIWYPVDPFALYFIIGHVGLLTYLMTMLITTFLAMARCMCVIRPFQFRNICTRKRSIIVLSGFAAFSFFSYAPLFFMMGIDEGFDPRINRTRALLWVTPGREKVKDIIWVFRDTTMAVVTQFTVAVCVIIMIRGLKESSKFRHATSIPGSNSTIATPVNRWLTNQPSDFENDGADYKYVKDTSNSGQEERNYSLRNASSNSVRDSLTEMNSDATKSGNERNKHFNHKSKLQEYTVVSEFRNIASNFISTLSADTLDIDYKDEHFKKRGQVTEKTEYVGNENKNLSVDLTSGIASQEVGKHSSELKYISKCKQATGGNVSADSSTEVPNDSFSDTNKVTLGSDTANKEDLEDLNGEITNNETTSNNKIHILPANSRSKLSAKERQVVLQVVLISIVYIVCNIPKICTNMAGFIEDDFTLGRRYSNIYFTTILLMLMFQTFNSSINFFIYYKFNSKFNSHCRCICFGKE